MDREQQVVRVADLIHQHSYGPDSHHQVFHSCACAHQAVALVDVARILAEANGFEVDIEALSETYLNPRVHVLPMISTERVGCGCSGHWMPGVRHVVACCDKPHIDQIMFTSVVTNEGVTQSWSMVCYCDTITGGAQVRKETCPIHGPAVKQAMSLIYPTQQESAVSCSCDVFGTAEDCLVHGSSNV